MNIDEENFNNAIAFTKDMTEILMVLLEKHLKETVEFCLQTNCSKGLIKLWSVLQEFRYE